MTGKPSSGGSNLRQALAGIAAYVTAALLIGSATSTIVQGIVGLADNRITFLAPNYLVEFNTAIWGWIHLIVGVATGAVACGLFVAATWARIAAITIASVSIVSMFLWVAHAPLWSVLTIVLDIIAIWALLTWSPHSDDNTKDERQ